MADPELLTEALEIFTYAVPAEGGGDYTNLERSIGDSGHLMVARRGQSDPAVTTEVASGMAGNEQVVEGLGLPQGTSIILATNRVSSAVIAAVYGSEEHDPLAPQETDDYGWESSGEASWVDMAHKPQDSADAEARISISAPLGRVLLVDDAGFEPRPGMPGHFYKVDTGDGIEAPEAFDVSIVEVLELAAAGLITWREHQTTPV